MMQIPQTLCGIDLLFVEWIGIAAYLAFGIWLFSRWATREEKPIPAWRWGDPRRRTGESVEAKIIEHIAGVVVFLSICIFGLYALGLE